MWNSGTNIFLYVTSILYITAYYEVLYTLSLKYSNDSKYLINYNDTKLDDIQKNYITVEVSSEERGIVRFQYTRILSYVGKAIGATRSISSPGRPGEIASLGQLER